MPSKRSVKLRKDVRAYLKAKKEEKREPHILDEWYETLCIKYDDLSVDDEISRQLAKYVEYVNKDLRYRIYAASYEGEGPAHPIRKDSLIVKSEAIVSLYVQTHPLAERVRDHATREYLNQMRREKARGLSNALPVSVGARTTCTKHGPAVVLNFVDTTTHSAQGKKHSCARILRLQRLIKELDKCTEHVLGSRYGMSEAYKSI